MSKNVEYGPLGPGHAPDKDPMKGLRGVMAGILSMESISLLLVLTVILRVDGGSYWTTFNWVYVSAVGVAHMVLAFMMKARWALPAIWVLQIFALAGIIVHVSMGIMAVVFIVVWAYVFYLRKNILERMRRGYLASQHT
ncbi:MULTISPECIES: DUF4233 domain-containing protein [unclassified Corynebacterium]|uniref:DUF4233 domain-containing protein n=1 Tax=unclassified Corynebacterium TaxID=2624378 RepID=UPI001C45F99E|nr:MULTISPECIES: DUF4233 domain-containing protein [unclassified Corynebacterium]MBV7281826.1 DUF4233 domain-containing protein [Corynebacterium sp. TAE3-ERU30]MBV7301462.1 DUF4233 domain-containing protein [Corynebacterium sp. TAE3-ERU2]